MILYALLNKKVKGLASGVKSHQVNGLDLILTFNDGTSSTISFSQPKDGVSVDRLEFNETTNELLYYLTDGTSGSAGTVPVGKDGLSAYEIAKKNGFDGTEQEWLDSLAAQGGKIDIIRVNGEVIAINPDDKSVDITIPEAPVQSISVNNEEVEPDENGNVNITIPKAPIQSISQDGTALEIDENGNVNIPIADTNKIEIVKVNNTALEIDEDKSVNIDLQEYAKTEDVEKFVDEQLYTTTTVEAHYELADAETIGALEVVADDATAAEGQINVSNVTPVLDGEVIAAGDYVIWVEAATIKDAKFLVEADLDPYVTEDEFKVMTEEELLEKLGLSEEELQGLAQLISDTEVRIDKTYSSSKIYSELQKILTESKTYTLEEISKKTGASYKIAATTADMTSTEYIYLLANGGTYDMYIVEAEGSEPVKIGTTNIDLNGYYTAEKTDALFAKLTSVGDLSNLKTEVNKSLVDAINWIIDVNAKTYATKTEIGDLTILKTTDKTSIVNAINELEYANYNAAKTYATQTTVGELSALKTTDKDSIVDAINENFNNVYNLNKSVATKTEMGDLTILKTKEKSNMVGAVNEVYNTAYNAATQANVGSLKDLVTDDKTSIVNAVNETKKSIIAIDDETASTDTVWSSKKTSDELAQKLNANNNVSMVGLGFTKGDTVHVSDFLGALVAKFGRNGYCNMLYANASSATVVNSADTQSVLINGGVLYFSATNEKFPNDTWSYAEAIYYPIEGIQGKIYKFFARTAGVAGTVSNSGIYQYSSDIEIINDTVSDSTSTYSSAKIDEKIATKQDDLSARKVYVRRNSSANKYVLLATIDMRVLTNLGQPLRIKGVIGNMANDITNIDLTINARNGFVKKILYGTVTHKNFLTNDVNIIITKSDDGKTAYVYLDCISIYGYIDAEIYLGSVHYAVPSTFDLVGTMQGTEYTNLLDSNYVVIENVINDTSTGDTNSTWSSSKIANEIGRTQVPHVGTSTGWKATKDLSSLPIGTYRLTSMHSSSGSVIDALILKTGYSYFLKTILKEGANITVGISDDTLTVAESTTSIGVISVFLNVVGINA